AARDARRTIHLIGFVKRELLLFQVIEHLLRCPVKDRVPIQPRGASGNAVEFWLYLRDRCPRPIGALLAPDTARREDHLIRKMIDQSPTDHGGFEFRGTETH